MKMYPYTWKSSLKANVVFYYLKLCDKGRNFSSWMTSFKGRLRQICNWEMSRPARKPTVCTRRKVSSRISLSMPRRLIRRDTPPVDFLFQESLLYTSIPAETECVGPYQSTRTAQPVLVDTLHRGQNVGFLAGRHKSYILINHTWLVGMICHI